MKKKQGVGRILQITRIDEYVIVCHSVCPGVIAYRSQEELVRLFGPSALKRIEEFELNTAAKRENQDTTYQREQTVEEKIKEALTDDNG